MAVHLDDDFTKEMEARAVEMATHAGKMLQGRFGGPFDVEYKDQNYEDPVTSADTEIQAYLCETIVRHFPDHAIVGEEDGEELESPISEIFWVLDPLDGTINFLNGLPIYGISIGVLYRGMPIAGAIYVAWPVEGGGLVLHARKGGGAWRDDQPLLIPRAHGLKGSLLTAGHGAFGAMFRVGNGLRRRVGHPRVTGSITYDLALTAVGASEYAIFGAPKIWDVAAGALIVTEAGGMVLVKQSGNHRWQPMTHLGPYWDKSPPSIKEVRGWVSSLIVGNAAAVSIVASSLRDRSYFTFRLPKLLRKLWYRIC